MRRGIRLSTAGGVLLLAVLLAAGGAAAGIQVPRVSPVLGSDFLISDANATSHEYDPAVAWNGTAHEYLVVRQDYRDSATRGSDIYGRLVSAAGSPMGADFRVSGANAISAEADPAVAWNGTANEYLVVWEDYRDSATRGSDVYGRRVAAGGSPIGSDFRISGAGGIESETTPVVAWNGTTNDYLVVWADERNSATRGWDIYGRRVAADGSRLGVDFRVSGTSATADEWFPALASNDADSEVLVIWQDGRNAATRGSDVYGRRVAADGSLIGRDFRVSGSSATAEEFDPAVAWNGTAGEYLVVWEDGRGFSTRGYDVYGRRVAADGSRLGVDFRVSGSNATANEFFPAVAWNTTSNQYMVVWEDDRSFATRRWDIYGRRIAADGLRLGADFRVSGADATGDEGTSAAAWNATVNEFLVVWGDTRDSSTRGQDIYGRRLAG